MRRYGLQESGRFGTVSKRPFQRGVCPIWISGFRSILKPWPTAQNQDVKFRTAALALAFVTSLFGQRKFSWQNACFNNPGLPYCEGRDFAVKPVKPGKNGSTGSYSGGELSLTAEDAGPSVIGMSGINWRFADPLADSLASASFNRMSPSPLARFVMSALAANQGLKEANMGTIFDAFTSVDQVALSIHGNQTLIMVAGCSRESTVPALEAGWKAVPNGNAMLIGPAEAVDQAAQRIAADGPLLELARLAGKRQSNGDIWVASSTDADAVKAGAKRLVVTASMRDRLTGDAVFEFSQAPDAKTIEMLQVGPGVTSVDGNKVHVKMAIEIDKVQPSLAEIASTPLGEYLWTLVKAGRYVPARDPAKALPKPKIAGLN
jgi:hypothetical protein